MTLGAALEGLRVLDLSRHLPGPLATQMLADFGADVVKVEEPGRGDPLRSFAPMRRGESAFFLNVNRNKRSVTLDLKNAAGRDVLLDLARAADVLVESFRPGVMERLGLGSEVLAAANPRLVHCAVTGYGQTGPRALEAGHDINYLARAGVLGLIRDADGRPVVPGVQIADVGGGSANVVVGVLLALAARERTGEGQTVDVAMVDGLALWLAYRWAFETADEPGIGPFLAGEYACYGVYETADGRFLAVGALEEVFWRDLCGRLDREDWVPLQYVSGDRQERLRDDLASVFLTRSRDDWVAEFDGADCCVTPVLEVDELPADAHWRERGLLVRPDDDGPEVLGPGIRLSGTPAHLRLPPPTLGEHTEQVMRELGYPPERLAALRRAGVFGAGVGVAASTDSRGPAVS